MAPGKVIEAKQRDDRVKPRMGGRKDGSLASYISKLIVADAESR